MQVSEDLEVIHSYILKHKPELLDEPRKVFAQVFLDNQIDPDDLEEDNCILLNYLFIFYVLFDNKFLNNKGKIQSGWEILKQDKTVKFDSFTTTVMNQINKAQWKIFRVSRKTRTSMNGYFQEVTFDEKLESFGPKYGISFLDDYLSARNNDLVLAKVKINKSSYSPFLKIPSDKSVVLGIVSIHKSILDEAKRDNIKLTSKELSAVEEAMLFQLAVASCVTINQSYQSFEANNYEELKSTNSIFLKSSGEFIFNHKKEKEQANQWKILNFKKLIKVFNKAKNIESFGDYSHVLISDEDEPKIMGKIQIDENEKFLKLESFSSHASETFHEFLRDKASSYVDFHHKESSQSKPEYLEKNKESFSNKKEYLGKIDSVNKHNIDEESVRDAIRDLIDQEIMKYQMETLGFNAEQFGFPIIQYFRMNKDIVNEWKRFANDKPERKKKVDSASYIGVFWETLITEKFINVGSKKILLGEMILDKFQSKMDKKVINFYLEIMKGTLIFFKVIDCKKILGDILIKDILTEEELTVLTMDNPISFLEPGKIFVAKMVTWKNRYILTNFILSYPTSYKKKIQKIIGSHEERTLFTDKNLPSLSEKLLGLHLDSLDANLGSFPLK